MLVFAAALCAQQWPYYGGDAGGKKYSPLDQIHRGNVKHLEVAWEYDTGDFSDGSPPYPSRSAFEATPLVVDGLLYIVTPFQRLIALEPETGEELWTFDSELDRRNRVNLYTSRGAAYWSDRDQAAPSSEVHRSESEEIGEVPKTVFVTVMFLVAGLAMLIGGAHVLIKGAVGIAEHLGVSEAVIGLTLVAVGTSLPELSISVIAAVRRHADVAVGNILGSNIFNLLGILGVSALLQPLPVHVRILQLDQWVMLAAAVLLLAFLCTARRLSRLEGFILVACYGSYIGVGIAAFD